MSLERFVKIPESESQRITIYLCKDKNVFNVVVVVDKILDETIDHE